MLDKKYQDLVLSITKLPLGVAAIILAQKDTGCLSNASLTGLQLSDFLLGTGIAMFSFNIFWLLMSRFFETGRNKLITSLILSSSYLAFSFSWTTIVGGIVIFGENLDCKSGSHIYSIILWVVNVLFTVFVCLKIIELSQRKGEKQITRKEITREEIIV